jgi:ABC-type uncharacterized transport system permease subunit
MQEISVFWLRAASALYAIGLFHTIQVAVRKNSTIFKPALVAFCAGLVLHMVSLVEAGRAAQTWFPPGFHNSISLWAFLLAIVFLVVYRRIRVESLGTALFPLVFTMSAVASTVAPLGKWTSTTERQTWLVVHIALVLLGYAALLLTALAALFYLAQERRLKRKKSIALLDKLPPLGTLDSLISRSLWFGFILITLGVVTGATWAVIESGGTGLNDPRMTSAVFTWAFCLLTLFMRINAGWRGRKAAVMAVAVVAFSAATWAVHYVIR